MWLSNLARELFPVKGVVPRDCFSKNHAAGTTAKATTSGRAQERQPRGARRWRAGAARAAAVSPRGTRQSRSARRPVRAPSPVACLLRTGRAASA